MNHNNSSYTNKALKANSESQDLRHGNYYPFFLIKFCRPTKKCSKVFDHSL